MNLPAPDVLERLKQLDKAATKAPWNYDSGYHDCYDGGYFGIPSIGAEMKQEDDAALIVAMRNALPALLAVVEAAEALVLHRHDGDGFEMDALRTALAALKEVKS